MCLRLLGSELVQSIVDVPGLVIHAETFRILPSPSLRFDTIVELADRIRREIAAGSDGVVVTQGTDTIEETAFVLDVLLADLAAPVVVTGAMRHPGLLALTAQPTCQRLLQLQSRPRPGTRGY